MSRAILSFLWLTFLWADSATLPFSGDYDRALIAVHDDLITGHFADCTGECKFECNFFFEGKRGARQFEIAAYFPGGQDVIRGTAKADGCWNVAPELNGDGIQLLLDRKTDWLQIRSTMKKSYLRDIHKGKETIRLEKGQTVIVLKKRNDWLYVRKPGGEETAGWLKESELYPLRIPGSRRAAAAP